MGEAICYYVACPRKDGKKPGIHKAYNNILCNNLEDAKLLQKTAIYSLDVHHEIYVVAIPESTIKGR